MIISSKYLRSCNDQDEVDIFYEVFWHLAVHWNR